MARKGTQWDFDGYWRMVLGLGSGEQVVAEFELDVTDRRGLDEWLGTAEVEAWSVGGQGGPMPEEWADHHTRALDMLCEVEAAS